MHIDVDNENNEIQQQEGPENGSDSQPSFAKASEGKKTRYKIEWKKFGLLLGGLILLAGLVFGGIWFFKKGSKDDPVKVYDVAVMLKDQTNKDPEEDAKTSLKAGDVVMTRETGREWSNTERISYLILKMKLRESQAEKLVEPVEEKLSEKEAQEKGNLPAKYKVVDDEDLNEERKKQGDNNEDREMIILKRELESRLTVTTRARKYRIKIEDLDFDPAQVRNGQPFPDQEFGWSIVEKK